MTKVLAFLQNMWVYPSRKERWEKLMASPHRHKYLRYALFAGCKTGKVLTKAGLREENILWEETSKQIGVVSGAVFPPDLDHMVEMIERFQPELILGFGKPAEIALSQITITGCEVMCGPHPAARCEVLPRLREIAHAVQRIYS